MHWWRTRFQASLVQVHVLCWPVEEDPVTPSFVWNGNKICHPMPKAKLQGYIRIWNETLSQPSKSVGGEETEKLVVLED